MWGEILFKQLWFRNPLGIAGGLDKNAKNMKDWAKLGIGFLEIGTVTLTAQDKNLGKSLLRDTKAKSLWNNLGFPNDGSDRILNRLKKYNPEVPLFVNIGKNRNTPNEKAHEEYFLLTKKFLNFADGFSINISSPNTKGLRELFDRDFLIPILKNVNHVLNQKIPKPLLLIKLSPDLDDGSLENVIKVCLDQQVDGFILTNTTLSKIHPFPKGYGGVSGKMLQNISLRMLKKTIKILGETKNQKLIISVGGVLSPSDVLDRLNLGANLVQTYTGFVFYGLDFLEDTMNLYQRQNPS